MYSTSAGVGDSAYSPLPRSEGRSSPGSLHPTLWKGKGGEASHFVGHDPLWGVEGGVSVSTAPYPKNQHFLGEEQVGTSTSYFNNLYQAFSYKPINLTYLNNTVDIKIKKDSASSGQKENNLKQIIEIRNLLVILTKMQNHIKLLISLRRKLILKKKIKIIKKILVEEAIKLKKEEFKKKIEIFNLTKETNKYISFPAKDSFYQKEILIFKEDIESMLANSFDLFVSIKNDLSFDQIMEGDETKINLLLRPDDSSYNSNNNNINNNKNNIRNIKAKDQQSKYFDEDSIGIHKNKAETSVKNNKYSLLDINKNAPHNISSAKNKDKKKALSAPQNLYMKYISNTDNLNPKLQAIPAPKDRSSAGAWFETNTIENGKHSIDRTQNKGIETYFNWPLGIKHAIEENKKKMVVTLKSMIYKHKKFDPEISIVENRTPVNLIFYSKNNNTIISQYLKSMSIFNMINKGTFIYFSSCIGYFFKLKNFKKFKNIYKLLFYFFKTMFCLISKPVFIHKSDKIIIQLYYFLILPNFFKDKLLRRNFRYNKLMKKFKKGEIKRRPYKYIANFKTKKRISKFNKFKLKFKILLKKASNVSLVNLYPKKFKIICNVLSKAFNKNIELNLIRLHYPYKDSNILANLLALLVNKIKLRRITRKLFKYAVIKNLKNIVFDNKANYIPAYLTGMTIKIGGRLMKYKVIPKKTSQKVQKGASSFGKVNFTDLARYTSKNRRGAFSITVSSGHNFF